ncbi:MAG: DUF4190 domain-containing protein [Planctomycetota bacterium]
MKHDPTAPTLGARRLSQFSDFGAPDADAFAAGPERTSILAILSLVCGVVCIIPGLGVLAVLLAIAAFFGISGSKGRIGGLGLAIAGLILGLLATVVWVGIGFGVKMAFDVYKDGATKITTTFQAIDAGDYTLAADTLGPAAQQLTVEDFELFRETYQAKLGAFVEAPDTFDGVRQAWEDFMQAAQGQGQGGQPPSGNNAIPIAATFENGSTLILYQMDTNPSSQQGGSGPQVPPAADLILFFPDGDSASLFFPRLERDGEPVGGLESDVEDVIPAENPDASPADAEPEPAPAPGF